MNNSQILRNLINISRNFNFANLKHINVHFQSILRKNFACSLHFSPPCKSLVSPVYEHDRDLSQFIEAYPFVRNCLSNNENKALCEAVNWCLKVLDYNVQDGKKTRGLTVLKTYKAMCRDTVNPNSLLLASILGWCVEILQAFFLVADDIMDNSSMRRGKPCWYKQPEVGLNAVNDALLLECSIYQILEKFLRTHPNYYKILQEFLEVTRKTVYGQCLDVLYNSSNAKSKYENFTMQNYKTIVEYKTSYYTFCLPVHLAIHQSEKHFTSLDFKLIDEVCLKLGLLFQIQDDHLDCFGDPAVTGKYSSDVREGKCTWFAATIMEEAPEPMLKIFKENYGIDNEESVSTILKLYKDFRIEEKFFELEGNLLKEIKTQTENKLLLETFSYLISKLDKRKK